MIFCEFEFDDIYGHKSKVNVDLSNFTVILAKDTSSIFRCDGICVVAHLLNFYKSPIGPMKAYKANASFDIKFV